jgi:hypothetical protein
MIGPPGLAHNVILSVNSGKIGFYRALLTVSQTAYEIAWLKANR